MATPYIGEIRRFGVNFAPQCCAFCNGQVLPISDYDVLFNLIGTTYGGDGQSTFALPDLQSRVPIHMGSNAGNTYTIGQNGGVESVTLTQSQMPLHSHVVNASNTGGSDSPANKVWGNAPQTKPYGATPGNANMNPASVGNAGGSQPHDNMIPFLAINFIIALEGIYPSQF